MSLCWRCFHCIKLPISYLFFEWWDGATAARLLLLVRNYRHCLLATGHCLLDRYMISIILFLLFDASVRLICKIPQNFLPPTALLTSVEIPHQTIQTERKIRIKYEITMHRMKQNTHVSLVFHSKKKRENIWRKMTCYDLLSLLPSTASSAFGVPFHAHQ